MKLQLASPLFLCKMAKRRIVERESVRKFKVKKCRQ